MVGGKVLIVDGKVVTNLSCCCEEFCQDFINNSTLTITFSGVSICGCQATGPDSSSSIVFNFSINSAFSLTKIGEEFTAEIGTANVNIYDENAACSGEPSSTAEVPVGVTVNCNEGLVTVLGVVAGINFFQGSASEGEPIFNIYNSSDCFTTSQGYDGQATISFP